jgi:hypothetical protein
MSWTHPNTPASDIWDHSGGTTAPISSIVTLNAGTNVMADSFVQSTVITSSSPYTQNAGTSYTFSGNGIVLIPNSGYTLTGSTITVSGLSGSGITPTVAIAGAGTSATITFSASVWPSIDQTYSIVVNATAVSAAPQLNVTTELQTGHVSDWEIIWSNGGATTPLTHSISSPPNPNHVSNMYTIGGSNNVNVTVEKKTNSGLAIDPVKISFWKNGSLLQLLNYSSGDTINPTIPSNQPLYGWSSLTSSDTITVEIIE